MSSETKTSWAKDANGNFYDVNFTAIVAAGGTAAIDEAAFTAAVTPGTPLMGIVNPGDTPPNGDLAIAALDSSRRLKVAGSFSSTPVTAATSTAASQLTVGTTAGQVLAANSNRLKYILQNCGTTVIKIILGAGTPTQSNYHFSLAPCGTANDGSSQSIIDTMWIGAIQAISSAAGGLLQVTELTA